MSIVMNFALLVEMVLFSNKFTVVRSAVGVLMLPSYSSLSPPTHSCTRSRSDFDGLWVHMIVMYVNFRPDSTLERGMKNNVFVHFVFPYPWDNLPSSLHIPPSHFSLYSGFCIRFIYSNISPVVLSKTALAIH